MANETKTIKKETGNNLTPIIIIGAILLATIGGIYLISQSGGDGNDGEQVKNKSASGSNNGTSNTSKPDSGAIANYNSASPGASPAHFKGSQNSVVVLEEFADFQCPTCKTVHPRINEIISKYGDRIQVIFRQYPLTAIHAKAYDAAVATEAAGLQGKFWEMQNIMFNNQTSWVKSQNHKQEFENYAKTIGLDVEKFSNDMLGLPAKGRVDADMKRGRELNIQSTPSVLINGKLVPFEQMEVNGMMKLIDAEIAKTKPRTDEKPAGEKVTEEKPEDKDEEKSADGQEKSGK